MMSERVELLALLQIDGLGLQRVWFLLEAFGSPAAVFEASPEALMEVVDIEKELTPEQATLLVVKHLVNRSRSTSSRLKAQCRNRSPTEI